MHSNKIKLFDLLQYVLEQRHKYANCYLFDANEGYSGSSGNTAWCKLVVDDLTDEIRQTVSKMQDVAFCVLGLKLSVTIYAKNETINYKNVT